MLQNVMNANFDIVDLGFDKLFELLPEQFELITLPLHAGFDVMKTWLQDLFNQGVDLIQIGTDLPVKIFEPFADVFDKFFIPDAELFNERMAAVTAKFIWVTDVTEYGRYIIGMLQKASGNKPPVITISLSKYAGNFSWGTNDIVIDFSWYAPYKPNVDAILSGIIWINFLWNIFKRLPDIISGSGMITMDSIKIYNSRNKGDES